MATSSSSVTLEPKYDVFLSFRGDDTRDNFTSHLYSALCREKIATFFDEDGLKRGDAISPVLLRAIEESTIAIIIFSKDYASSGWCLDELAKIIECKKIIVPVFYHVDPSDIRYQRGSFKDAFVKHEERFKDAPGRVERWRDALTKAANLSGLDSMKIRPEAKLVGAIVQDILKKLNDSTPPNNNFEGLVGIKSRIERIYSLLSESQVLGIWGMGGIGKTTLAKALFSQISAQFEGCCFIENFREESKKCDGLLCLQQKIISRILQVENPVIDALNIIPQFIKHRLQCRKVLVVLDDVDNSRQLNLLIRELKPLGPGSRIIITARDKQVFDSYEAHNIYEVVGLDHNEALLLFSKCALKQNHPPEHLQHLSNMILAYAKGNPLALQVLGSSLRGKSKEDWESVKDNLEMIGGNEIHDVLRISYDGLNEIEKNIFLDIACFFNWKNENDTKKILEACYESTQYCLRVLIDKALIKIFGGCLLMHDLLQEMGRKIVLQRSEDNPCKKEFEDNPGKRSRLWDANDIYRVLQNNEGTDAVKSIVLDMRLLSGEIRLSSKAFKKMVNLRVLKLYWGDGKNIFKVQIPEGLICLSNEMRYLRWDGYPWEKLPLKFSAYKLVELKLPYSKLNKLWEEDKHVCNLKSIDVSHSKLLTEFPRLQNASKLEITNFEGCEMLRKAPSSINQFTNLELLNMKHCKSLRRVSRKIHFTSPIWIDFSDCINLKEFPQISGNVISLRLNRTAIEEVAESIKDLPNLRFFEMGDCSSLRSILANIHFTSPINMYFSDCINLRECPPISGNVRNLFLDGTAIEEVPPSVASLTKLSWLHLERCSRLRSISTNICKLGSLRTLDLKHCSKLKSFPEIKEEVKDLDVLSLSGTTIKQLSSSIERQTSLVTLRVGRCKNLAANPSISQIPSSIADRGKISTLFLSFCSLTDVPESIGCLLSLIILDLRGNKFESLPRSIKQLSNLRQLHLSDCNMLQSIPELPLRLLKLNARNCAQLQSLPELPSNVEEFGRSDSKEFNFINCMNLNESISRQRIQKMAAALQLHRLKVHKKEPAFSFVLPGSEIPKWFKIKNSGSSIAVKVPPLGVSKGS